MDEETSNRDHKPHKSPKFKKASSHKEEGGEGSRYHDRDEKSKKRHRHRDDGRDGDGDDKSRKHKHKRSKKKDEIEGMKVHDGSDDADIWVEKTFDPEENLARDIPTSKSLSIKSHASDSGTNLPPTLRTESSLKRDDWMMLEHTAPTVPETPQAPSKPRVVEDEPMTEDYGDAAEDKRSLGGGVDFFSSLGTERKKKQPDRPDPEKLQISSRELNSQLVQGKSLDEYTTPTPAKPNTPGGPGSQWRMTKLKRTFELAEEDGRSVEEVARERYDSLEAFEEAKNEKRILEERETRRAGRVSTSGNDSRNGGRQLDRDRGGGEKRWMFSDFSTPESRSSSQNSFRRPGNAADSTPSTPQPSGRGGSAEEPTPANKRLDSLRLGRGPSGSGKFTPPAARTPIPSVMTPTRSSRVQQQTRSLSPSSLNKLQARVLRAKLMGAPDADALEKEYEIERSKPPAQSGGVHVDADGTRVEVLPTLDGRGRLYDVGLGKDEEVLPGNRKKKLPVVETRDSKTGEVLRINADDDSTTLGEMLRQERFGAGMADQKDIDAELAGAIMGDGKFEDDLEYMDDNAEKLGRKKMRTDAMKRQFAINDYARTQKALASCQFCYGEDDSPPKAAVIAMGTRVYLSCTQNEELVDGHCYIVPIQHHLSMLEGDDDMWDEVRNFMKCLMRMAADEGKGVIFYETVLTLKWQKHTFIECVPVPLDQFHDLPAYFKESILASESEWSQHKKLIDFSSRPGGFRRAMVPKLPYFMVQWDYKGEQGYGHVIEGVGDAAGAGEGDGAVDEGDKGGGEFPRYFAAEIIGNVLEVDQRRWRRPKRLDSRMSKDRISQFKKKYDKYDWTGMIGKT